MAIEKKIGRPTSRVASSTASITWRRLRGSIPRCSMKRKAFSVTTMAASTSTPIAMAMPASDMMLEVIPR